MTGARRVTGTIRSSIFCAAIALVALGCHSNPKQSEAPPLAAPAGVKTRVTYFAGSPLSGPTTRAVAAINPADTLAVKVTFVALAKLPAGDAWAPLPGRSRLVAATRGGVPVLATGRLTQTARVAATTQPDFGSPAVEIAFQRGALAPGTTAVFQASDPGDAQLPDRRRVEIDLHRPADATPQPQVGIALIVADYVTPAPPEPAKAEDSEHPAAPAPPAQPEFQREITLLDPLTVADATSIAIVVPFRFTGGANEAVAALIELSPGADTPEQRDAIAHASEELKRSTEQAAKRPDVAAIDSPEWFALRGAVESLYFPERRRAALVFLSDQTGARICADVALVADDATLAKLCQPIVARVKDDDPSLHTRTALGWLLDASSFKLMGEAMSAGTIAPELAAVLTQHAGEAGRHAGSIDEVMRGTSSRQDLDNRLTAENFIFLEDSSPASRVRAFDWLRARGRAPEGYDPLGGNKDRRAALERALSAPPTSAPTTAPTNNPLGLR